MSGDTQAADRKPRNDEIDVFGVTHPGLVRPVNQDHFLISVLGTEHTILQTSLPDAPAHVVVPAPGSTDRQGVLAMVADGVGSSALGGEASRLAVEEVAQIVAGSMTAYYSSAADDDAEFLRELERGAQRTHEELRRRASADEEQRGMATTLTLWLGVWPRVYLLQIGDSRYYRYRDGALMQLSRDQTVAQELVDQGVLTPENARRTRWTHVLSSALGGPHSTPMITRIENEWSSVHLLCSDGLTKHVSDKRIRDTLATMSSARQACESLLKDALDDGGTDNITIIVGRAVRRW